MAGELPAPEPGEALHRYYEASLLHLGPQRWWPARTRLEVILGAILTQNTAWRNAALALKRLRKTGLLKVGRLVKASQAELESCVRPAGFFRQKAQTIRNFLDWLGRAHRGSLAAAFAQEPAELRRQLLEIKGFGPETADAILLYAGHRPFWVADAYTRRILARHALLASGASYSAAQAFLHRHLPADHALFNEYHALLVEVGKRYCQPRAPRCDACPLKEFLPPTSGARLADARAGNATYLSRVEGPLDAGKARLGSQVA